MFVLLSHGGMEGLFQTSVSYKKMNCKGIIPESLKSIGQFLHGLKNYLM